MTKELKITGNDSSAIFEIKSFTQPGVVLDPMAGSFEPVTFIYESENVSEETEFSSLMQTLLKAAMKFSNGSVEQYKFDCTLTDKETNSSAVLEGCFIRNFSASLEASTNKAKYEAEIVYDMYKPKAIGEAK